MGILDAPGQSPKRSKTGFFIPSDWGQFYLPKLAAAKAGTGLVTIAAPGDSLTAGMYCSHLDNKSFLGLCRIGLQSYAGDGGSGFKPGYHSQAGIGDASYVAGGQIAVTGTWQANTGIPDGPGACPIKAVSLNATATYSVRGTIVDVFFMTDNNVNFGSCQVVIDGVTKETFNTNTGTQGMTKRTYSGLSAGTHTVVLTATDAGGAVSLFVCGVKARNATGVVVDNYGRGGYPSNAFANLTSTTFTNSAGTNQGGGGLGLYGKAGQWSGGSKHPADLVIYSLGLNDAHMPTPNSIDAWAYNVRKYLDDVKDGTGQTGATDIVLLMQHNGKVANWDQAATQYYAGYTARALGLARTYGAALIDLWALSRNSWNYGNSLSHWGQHDGTGAAGTDDVHRSDAGHQWIADALLPFLKTGLPA